MLYDVPDAAEGSQPQEDIRVWRALSAAFSSIGMITVFNKLHMIRTLLTPNIYYSCKIRSSQNRTSLWSYSHMEPILTI